MPKRCPECTNGKHPNCTGMAWDDALDGLDVCGCTCDEGAQARADA